MQALRGTRSEGRTGRWLALAVGLLALWMGAGHAQAKDETGQWGQRLVEKRELPPEAVARFLQFEAKNAQAAPGTPRPGGLLADSESWRGSEVNLVSSGNPYTMVIKASGVALADGDLGVRMQAGWAFDGSTHMVLMPEMSQKDARSGQVVELVGASVPVSMKEDRKAEPVIEFSASRNLRLDKVQIEVWSGIRTSSPIELLMSWVPLLLGTVFLGFVWWARRQ